VVRHLSNEKWIKLAHLEEVKVVTRFGSAKLMIFLRFEFIQGCGSFAEALAAIVQK